MEMVNQVRQTVADFIAPKEKKAASSESYKKKLAEVKKTVKEWNSDHADTEDALNLAYLRGNHYVYVDPVSKKICELARSRNSAGKWAARYQANLLLKTYINEMAMIFKNPVIMEGVPKTDQQTDKTSAEIATKLLYWLEDAKNLPSLDREAASWGITTRIAFMHPYWESNAGRLVDQNTGAHEGDIAFDVLSCFEFRYDKSVPSWKESRWGCKVKVRDIDKIYEIYGAKVDPEIGLTSNNIYDTKMSFGLNVTGEMQYTELKHHARVFEYWELPSREYPRGMRLTYVENRDEPLFSDDDIGFGDKDDTERELPFFPFVEITLPGNIAGTNRITQGRPIVREYEKTRNQITDCKDLFASPRMAIEMGSDIDEIDTDITKPLVYDKNAPVYVQPPQMGADAYQQCQMLREEYDTITGQGVVSRGQMPSKDASGYMLEIMLEQENTNFLPTLDQWLLFKQKYMSYALKMVHFMYAASRKLRITGDEGIEMLDVAGESFNTWDVKIQRGSVLTGSKTAVRAEVMNLATMGFLQPGRDDDLVFRLMEFGSINELFNDAEVDQKQARKEQMRWEKGNLGSEALLRQFLQAQASGAEIPEPPGLPVRAFFNHALHVKEHNRWRKSDRYEQMPPETQALVDAHVAQHEKYMIEAMQETNPQSGPPSGPPTPPIPSGTQTSEGTPFNTDRLKQRMGNGEPIGNPMQGRGNPAPVA